MKIFHYRLIRSFIFSQWNGCFVRPTQRHSVQLIPLRLWSWNQRIFGVFTQKNDRNRSMFCPLTTWLTDKLFELEERGELLIAADIWTTNYSLHIEVFVKWCRCSQNHWLWQWSYQCKCLLLQYNSENQVNSVTLFSSQPMISLHFITKQITVEI